MKWKHYHEIGTHLLMILTCGTIKYECPNEPFSRQIDYNSINIVIALSIYNQPNANSYANLESTIH